MSESLLTGILIFGIIQSLFFSLLFSTKKGKALPDKIMGVWLLILALQTFLILLINQDLTIPLLKNSSVLLTLLYGPMLFLYVSKISLSLTRFSYKDFIHFSPFALFLILILSFGESDLIAKLLAGISALSGISYSIFCLIILQNHQNNIENTFSYIEKINLAWVNRLVISLLIIWTGVFLLVGIDRFLHIEIPLNWFFTMIPVFIFYIGYYGIKQQAINNTFVNGLENNTPPIIQKTIKSYENSYVKSGLMPESMREIHSQLLACMKNDELFLNPTLSLTELSETLKIPAHHITQTLNDYAKLNFCDFVNGFRVEAFKSKIDSGEAEKFSLLGIAFDCGFNSKSSFNRIFRNISGVSPSEYKKYSPLK
jgi:AraC-like DNA-binding protein